MNLKLTLVGVILASVLAAPVAAGPFEDAVDAHARGDHAKAPRLIRPPANDGDAAVKFNPGLMYVASHGMQQDSAAAMLMPAMATNSNASLPDRPAHSQTGDGRKVSQTAMFT
ncbi:hypothetical protein MA20_41480 [Bradyrhizobium japonicum]|uniref:Uncharacterized protein n=2 Tax=Bradyrhizobium japonicum TaxID=375 RepID=A0A0A3XHX3_BRAJP|nr:hypothetical protein [Bradyrhizobium japonicum]KGT73982.1 hypothetical protein MA20_41480 [Bradyrhizobium japonicum]